MLIIGFNIIKNSTPTFKVKNNLQISKKIWKYPLSILGFKTSVGVILNHPDTCFYAYCFSILNQLLKNP